MISLRRIYFDIDESTGLASAKKGFHFNLGAAIVVNPNVKVMQDGVKDGTEVGSDYTPRFAKEAQLGLAIIFSATF